jgi:hypothetical protein
MATFTAHVQEQSNDNENIVSYFKNWKGIEASTKLEMKAYMLGAGILKPVGNLSFDKKKSYIKSRLQNLIGIYYRLIKEYSREITGIQCCRKIPVKSLKDGDLSWEFYLLESINEARYGNRAFTLPSCVDDLSNPEIDRLFGFVDDLAIRPKREVPMNEGDDSGGEAGQEEQEDGEDE